MAHNTIKELAKSGDHPHSKSIFNVGRNDCMILCFQEETLALPKPKPQSEWSFFPHIPPQQCTFKNVWLLGSASKAPLILPPTGPYPTRRAEENNGPVFQPESVASHLIFIYTQTQTDSHGPALA